MRVGLNATCFNDRPSGANQRFRGIYGSLIRQRPDIEFVIYEPVDQRIGAWFGDAPNVSVRATPLPSAGRLARVRAGWSYWRQKLRADRLDVFETFNLPLVRAPDCPTILTIHDLRPVLADVPRLSRMLALPVMHHALGRADHVIAVSDAVADEIRAFHPAARVSTVHNGVDPAAFSVPDADTIAGVRSRYGLGEDYVLTVGHLEARKNLTLLIDAMALLRDRGRPHQLAIVGNDGGERRAIHARIALHALTDQITVIEHADDATVRALYAGCRLLAFPSRYEGFGIPILEAMAMGKPMVLADTAVFHELTLGKGCYFPVDDAGIAGVATEAVWDDPAVRSRQIAFGTSRVRDFAFDRLAGKIATVYAKVSDRLDFRAGTSPRRTERPDGN